MLPSTSLRMMASSSAQDRYRLLLRRVAQLNGDVSNIELNDAEIEMPRAVRRLNPPTRLGSVGDALETRTQRQFGFPHVVAGFSSVKRRQRGIRKTAPGAANFCFQCTYVFVQSCRHFEPP